MGLLVQRVNKEARPATPGLHDVAENACFSHPLFEVYSRLATYTNLVTDSLVAVFA